MPEVGNKKFPYTPEGIGAAREESARTGVPMNVKQHYQSGGLVKKAGLVKKTKTRGSRLAKRGNTHRP